MFKVINLPAVTWGISAGGHILYITEIIQPLLFTREEEKKKAQSCYYKFFFSFYWDIEKSFRSKGQSFVCV